MTMPGRKYTAPSSSYRYGFNGKEEDDEVSGDGNQYDYGFRIYNPRLGRFLSVDPLTRSYPWYTPYQFAGNKPIIAIDLDGLEEKEINLIVTATYASLRTIAAEMAKTNPNQLAALQQEAWNKVLVEIDALIPKYFDYKKNATGILWEQYMDAVDDILQDSKTSWEFNSFYNYDLENYKDINGMFRQAATDLANDHFRASINSREFYEKYLNGISQAKDPNTKAILINDRSNKSWDMVVAFNNACYFGAALFLDMYSFGKGTTPQAPKINAPSKYFNFSSNPGSALRFVRNQAGQVEDLAPTLDRIRTGGRYPHRNDGSIFENRIPRGATEPKLPVKPFGYYREYVHPTQGASGPGRQRIVTGQGGEMYYTNDHYDSFIQIR
jgi:RHS repeat-associated protein